MMAHRESLKDRINKRRALERTPGFDRTRYTVRGGELWPRTRHYQCHRCLLTVESGPLPGPPALPIYPLPEGWKLIQTPRSTPTDDKLRCVECQRDIERGSPVELGR